MTATTLQWILEMAAGIDLFEPAFAKPALLICNTFDGKLQILESVSLLILDIKAFEDNIGFGGLNWLLGSFLVDELLTVIDEIGWDHVDLRIGIG